MDERNRELVKDEHGPWGPRDGSAPPPQPTAQEPLFDGPVPGARAFNIPWPALALLAVIIVGFLGLRFLPDAQLNGLILTADALRAGRWYALLSYIFVNVGWTNVLLSCVFMLAFSGPVTRLMGETPRGALVFFVFFLLCGAIAGLTTVAVMPGVPVVVLGASGGAAGLMGAASRLMERRGALAPILSRGVLGLGAAWAGINTFIAFTTAPPAAGQAVLVTWPGHLAAFALGVLLVGVFARLAGKDPMAEPPLPGS